ncbi:flagellar assembly protein FliW [Lysinibacillus sp. BF-4]|uniref:flagellar assembly protein FliW n=1 Tax=Lysinibacillus sp. BF-4 TaxID=1473546 RepID=UPI00050832E1|nr:flagellar assembly protein FliW [Lysinibacillus sp. BF-4]KFL43948.1 flagellar assembly protein FliW [Lysinibacillus sp. BF-4]
MKIETKFLGEVDIVEEDIYTFENGLPGFEDLTKFVLIPLDADLPLAILQSTEQAPISFVVAYPFAFNPSYAFDLSEEDKQALHIETEDEVVPYAIVTMNDTFDKSTINLLAPIILNITKKCGKQVVLGDSKKYPLHYQIKESVK